MESIMLPILDIDALISELNLFCTKISSTHHKEIKGITDGKAIGTHIEHAFKNVLEAKYTVTIGNSALGIDLPSDSINTDIKVTSVVQPQSSSPFKSASQKIFGLGYNLLLFVYEKDDDKKNNLQIVDCAFINKDRTADFQTTKGILSIIKNDGNADDLEAFLRDRNLPVDDVEMSVIIQKIIKSPPNQGYLTISNALQWRLQYARIVGLKKNEITGIVKVL